MKKVQKEETPEVKSIDSFEINGKTYRKINLNTEFTFRQSKTARKILVELLGSTTEQENIKKLMSLDVDSQILALLYVPEGKKWNEQVYKETINAIEDSSLKIDEFEQEVAEFISFFTKSTMGVFHSLSKVKFQ